MDGGVWTPASREQYNLRDAVSRCTTQVYYLLFLGEKFLKFIKFGIKSDLNSKVMKFLLVICRYTQSHGLPFICHLTMLECGT